MKIRSCAGWLALVALSACSSSTVKDTLGLYRSAPDEYRVVARPPLSVPPQFGLRPPSNTDLPPGQVKASEQAEAVVLRGEMPSQTGGEAPAKPAKEGKAKPTATRTTSADANFLKKLGADQADPKVRDALVEEQYQRIEEKESGSWVDKFDWMNEKGDPLVDAKKEAERIKTNEDTGQPVTEGETPQRSSPETGFLGKILGN